MRNLTTPFLSLALFLFALAPAQASELEFLFYRAPKPLDWSTPGSLIRTTFQNGSEKISRLRWYTLPDGSRTNEVESVTYPHSISHVDVKVKCGNEAPIYRGMTGTKPDLVYAFQLFIMGDALETLITATGGRFYKNDEILGWLPLLEEKGYVRSFRVQLNDGQCGRVKSYLSEYEDLGLDRIYGGLRDDARLGQGAGCSAFAASVLEVAGLALPSITNEWKRKLLVPEDLMTTQSHQARISIVSFLAGENGSWARNSEANVPLNFWDPEKMYSWVGNVAEGKVQPGFSAHVLKSAPGNFETLVWDASALPVPTEPLYKLPRPQLLDNADHHRTLLDKLFTPEELRNPLAYECRHFHRCQ